MSVDCGAKEIECLATGKGTTHIRTQGAVAYLAWTAGVNGAMAARGALGAGVLATAILSCVRTAMDAGNATTGIKGLSGAGS